MTVVLGNRALETTTTTGTGTYSLAGAVTGYQTLVAAVAAVAGGGGPWSVKFCVEMGSNWEVGTGLLTNSSPDTLSRVTLEDSSTGSWIDWSAGTKNVFIIPSAAQLSSLLDEDRSDGFLKQTDSNEYTTIADPLPIANGGTGVTSASAARSAFDVMQNLYTARGDIPVAVASAAESKLAIGPAGSILESDGTDPSWTLTRWPPFYIQGFESSGPGSTWEVSYNIGSATCHTTPGSVLNTYYGSLSGAFSKKLDGSSWVPGTGNNGLATGATTKAAKFWYAAFLVMKSSDGSADIGFDSDVNGSNLKSDAAADGYDRLRFIGWVKVDASNADVEPFFYNSESGLWLYRDTLSISTTTTDHTITMSDNQIPEGDLDLWVGIVAYPNAAAGGITLKHPSSADDASTNIDDKDHWVNFPGAISSPATNIAVLHCNSSKQITYDIAGASMIGVNVVLKGFYTRRHIR